MIETSSVSPRKSSATFGNLRKMFEKCTFRPAVGDLGSRLHRGYYTVARRYEFYVRVARAISHE